MKYLKGFDKAAWAVTEVDSKRTVEVFRQPGDGLISTAAKSTSKGNCYAASH
jgi:hypothetical protein